MTYTMTEEKYLDTIDSLLEVYVPILKAKIQVYEESFTTICGGSHPNHHEDVRFQQVQFLTSESAATRPPSLVYLREGNTIVEVTKMMRICPC